MTRKILNPVTFATIIVIMYITVPIVSIFISTYITTYAYMLLTAFLVVFIMLSGGVERLSAIIRITFPFLVFIACTLSKYTRADSIVVWGYQNMLFILPVILGLYYMYYRPENIKLFSVIIIVLFFVTIITTITGLIRFPNAARILATIASSDDTEAIKYWWHNIGGYDFIYSCVLLYPLLILCHKLRIINRITFMAVFVLLLTLIIVSEYTIALLLFIISSILYFAGRRLSARQLFVLGITVFVLMFVYWDFVEKFLLWLADTLKSESVSDRLTAIAGGVEGLENSDDNRLELYRKSFNSFLSSPLFGTIFVGNSFAGGHAFILDSLADYGILGGAALIFSYRNIYRYFFKPFSKNASYGYALWAFVQAIILSAVNTGMWLVLLTFFIPILLTFIYNFNSEDVYEDIMDS